MAADPELQVDPNYQKGFNHGYILAKAEPDLYKQLAKSNNQHSTYFNALKAGGTQYSKEMGKGRFQVGRQQSTPQKGRDKGLDKE